MLNSLLRLRSSSEFVGQMDEDDQPFIYRRTVDIPAPGLSMLISSYLLIVVWYGFFIWLALWASGIGFHRGIIYAALVLGVNAAVRWSMRSRESIAVHVQWEKPVARQRGDIRILAVGMGFVFALVGFGILVSTVPKLSGSILAPLTIIVGMAVEGYRGGARVGGEDIDDDFDIDNHREWIRLGPADP